MRKRGRERYLETQGPAFLRLHPSSSPPTTDAYEELSGRVTFTRSAAAVIKGEELLSYPWLPPPLPRHILSETLKANMASSPINFPPSPATVCVRLVDTTAILNVRAQAFVEPVQKGHELLNMRCAAFLIEHEPSGRKIMFDLGVRKDYWNYPAAVQKRLGAIIPSLRVDQDVTEVLTDGGVSLDSICQCPVYAPVFLLLTCERFLSSVDHLVPLPLGSYGQRGSFPTINRAGRRSRVQGIANATAWVSGEARLAGVCILFPRPFAEGNRLQRLESQHWALRRPRFLWRWVILSPRWVVPFAFAQMREALTWDIRHPRALYRTCLWARAHHARQRQFLRPVGRRHMPFCRRHQAQPVLSPPTRDPK